MSWLPLTTGNIRCVAVLQNGTRKISFEAYDPATYMWNNTQAVQARKHRSEPYSTRDPWADYDTIDDENVQYSTS